MSYSAPSASILSRSQRSIANSAKRSSSVTTRTLPARESRCRRGRARTACSSRRGPGAAASPRRRRRRPRPAARSRRRRRCDRGSPSRAPAASALGSTATIARRAQPPRGPDAEDADVRADVDHDAVRRRLPAGRQVAAPRPRSPRTASAAARRPERTAPHRRRARAGRDAGAGAGAADTRARSPAARPSARGGEARRHASEAPRLRSRRAA